MKLLDKYLGFLAKHSYNWYNLSSSVINWYAAASLITYSPVNIQYKETAYEKTGI